MVVKTGRPDGSNREEDTARTWHQLKPSFNLARAKYKGVRLGEATLQAERPPVIYQMRHRKMEQLTEVQINQAISELEEAKINLANGEDEEAEKRIENARAILGNPHGPGE